MSSYLVHNNLDRYLLSVRIAAFEINQLDDLYLVIR